MAVADKKVLVTESALRDYPGMWVNTSGGNAWLPLSLHYALESKLKGDGPGHARHPIRRLPRQTSGTRSFPWRVLALARNDAGLLTNQLVYQLAEPQQITDTDWIRPGKVAWDWWNANNLYGVDFRAGINTQTYKYYIDFASRLGLEYIDPRRGLVQTWRPAIACSGDQCGGTGRVWPAKHVASSCGWFGRRSTTSSSRRWTSSRNGASGIKVDFMQRERPRMVNFYLAVAAAAAKRKMLVDYHGAYKPSGLRRAYPNVIIPRRRQGAGARQVEHRRDSDPQRDAALHPDGGRPHGLHPGRDEQCAPRNFARHL